MPFLYLKHLFVGQSPQKGMWKMAKNQMIKMLEIPAKHVGSQNAWKLAWNLNFDFAEYEAKIRWVIGVE